MHAVLHPYMVLKLVCENARNVAKLRPGQYQQHPFVRKV